MHGLLLNSRAGTIWKERVAGGEDLMLDMLPRRLNGIAEQLLGKGKVLPADGSSVGQMLGVPDDENFVRVLEERGKNDIGADSMCARWLHKLATEDWPVKKPPEANLHDMFVVGTRSRGIYATLPSPPDADRHAPGPGRGGHNDSHPFQLGVEAYIDDVPPNGGVSPICAVLGSNALADVVFRLYTGNLSIRRLHDLATGSREAVPTVQAPAFTGAG